MATYKVRIAVSSFKGIKGMSLYEDYLFESTLSISDFALLLLQRGFECKTGRWIMPGAILWIERKQ